MANIDELFRIEYETANEYRMAELMYDAARDSKHGDLESLRQNMERAKEQYLAAKMALNRALREERR